MKERNAALRLMVGFCLVEKKSTQRSLVCVYVLSACLSQEKGKEGSTPVHPWILEMVKGIIAFSLHILCSFSY